LFTYHLLRDTQTRKAEEMVAEHSVPPPSAQDEPGKAEEKVVGHSVPLPVLSPPGTLWQWECIG